MILRTGNKEQQSEFSGQRSEKKLITDRWAMNAERGLTLIEVLLAVSILAIGVIGVLRGYAGSIATLEAGQYTIDATGLLKQKMADVEQTILEAEVMPQGGEHGAFESPFEEFLWEWEIKPTEVESLKKLTLMISNPNTSRIFALNTFVADKKIEKEEGDGN